MFDAVYAHKVEVEASLAIPVHWDRGDDKKASKVFVVLPNVSINKEEDWPRMRKFHAEWSKKVYDAMVEYIQTVI